MVMRLGQLHPEWDNAYLVNTFLRGL
jgi:hypothetical protein